jgi:hypothetical protein
LRIIIALSKSPLCIKVFAFAYRIFGSSAWADMTRPGKRKMQKMRRYFFMFAN